MNNSDDNGLTVSPMLNGAKLALMLTKREHIATAIMAGGLHYALEVNLSPSAQAHNAVMAADALLLELAK